MNTDWLHLRKEYTDINDIGIEAFRKFFHEASLNVSIANSGGLKDYGIFSKYVGYDRERGVHIFDYYLSPIAKQELENVISSLGFVECSSPDDIENLSLMVGDPGTFKLLKN